MGVRQSSGTRREWNKRWENMGMWSADTQGLIGWSSSIPRFTLLLAPVANTVSGSVAVGFVRAVSSTSAASNSWKLQMRAVRVAEKQNHYVEDNNMFCTVKEKGSHFHIAHWHLIRQRFWLAWVNFFFCPKTMEWIVLFNIYSRLCKQQYAESWMTFGKVL